MNCELKLERSNIPDTKVILIDYLEEKYGLKLEYLTDKIYYVNKKGEKVLLDQNNLEDIKDHINDPVTIHITKEKNIDSRANKRQIENMLKELDTFDFNKAGNTGESFYIKPDDDKKDTKQDNSNSANNNLLVEAFNKIIGYLQLSTYSATQEFDMAMLQNPYGELYYNTLKCIQQSKTYITDMNDKFKKLEQYASNMEKAKINLEMSLKNREKEGGIGLGLDNSTKNLILNFQNAFLSKCMDANYVPDNISKEHEFIADFYNNLLFQVKNFFVLNLRALEEFFDHNSGMIRMILKSSGYTKVKDLMKVDENQLESKDIKKKCDVFSIFLQNIYNLID